MATVIIPTAPHTDALVQDLHPGAWISTDAIRWHHVLVVDLDGQTLTVGDDAASASTVPLDAPDAHVLLLDSAHAPRLRPTVQTLTHTTDTKISDGLPAPSDPRSTR